MKILLKDKGNDGILVRQKISDVISRIRDPMERLSKEWK